LTKKNDLLTPPELQAEVEKWRSYSFRLRSDYLKTLFDKVFIESKNGIYPPAPGNLEAYAVHEAQTLAIRRQHCRQPDPMKRFVHPFYV
jgi:hypothetical protein